ncbi:MAG: thioredoxin family protein [Polyangiaceae bacterium]
MFPRALTPPELNGLLEQASDRLLLVYLWGPDCPNCVIFKRSLQQFESKLDELPLEFVSVDAYSYPEVARRYAVHGIPHFLLFKGGRKIGKMSEFRGEKFWLAVVREQATGVAEPAPP